MEQVDSKRFWSQKRVFEPCNQLEYQLCLCLSRFKINYLKHVFNKIFYFNWPKCYAMCDF